MSMIKKVVFLLVLALVVDVFVLVFVWAHKLFVVGLNPFAGSIIVVISLAVGIPLAVFGFRRLSRWLGVREWMDPAMLFALGGFVLLFSDLVTRPVFRRSTLDIQVHDTLFVIAKADVSVAIVVLMFFISGVYAVYRRLARRAMDAPMGYVHFAMTFVALFATIWPVRFEGLAGMPRRYLDYSGWVTFDSYDGSGVFWTWAAVLLVCGQLLFVVNLVYSAVRDRK
jgi:cytochrome c oxidase subunit I